LDPAISQNTEALEMQLGTCWHCTWHSWAEEAKATADWELAMFSLQKLTKKERKKEIKLFLEPLYSGKLQDPMYLFTEMFFAFKLAIKLNANCLMSNIT
jgi:hydroxypyruvate isomerase